jgi:hypothetical protein
MASELHGATTERSEVFVISAERISNSALKYYIRLGPMKIL